MGLARIIKKNETKDEKCMLAKKIMLVQIGGRYCPYYALNYFVKMILKFVPNRF